MFDHLLTEEQRRVRNDARDFVKATPRQLILDMDQDKVRFPREWLREAGRRNLLGVRHPRRWGGRGMDWVTACAVSEEIGSLSYELACVFSVGADLVCDAILIHGTDAQKERYVKPLLKGDIFAAECLTEPRGGSDFFGATSTAEDKGDYFLLNGQKRFIVGAEGADYFLVYARTSTDPAAPPQQSITCFIVDRGPGVEVTYLYSLMGCRGGGTGRLVFKDVKVPKENVLGQVNGAYPVFNTMMIPERLGTAAMTIGAARPALVYTTSRAVDGGMEMNQVRRLISETKKFVTESCQKAVHNAMQVVGGIGYTNVLPLERIYRDIRLASIWTGTNEVMAMIVAHEWYREAAAARGARVDRDHAADAPEAEAAGEIIYE